MANHLIQPDTLNCLDSEYRDNEEEYQYLISLLDNDTSFIGRPLSEVSLDIPFQDNKVFLNKNFDRLNETEEDKIDREAREEESRLSIAKYEEEQAARVQALITKHGGSDGEIKKVWNGEYRIDYPCSRGLKN